MYLWLFIVGIILVCSGCIIAGVPIITVTATLSIMLGVGCLLGALCLFLSEMEL